MRIINPLNNKIMRKTNAQMIEIIRKRGYTCDLSYDNERWVVGCRRYVVAFKKRGYKTLHAYAIRSETYNGYNTWSKLGYELDDSGPENEFCWDLLKKMGFNSLTQFATKVSSEQRDEWRKAKCSFHGVFDLSDDSKSLEVLRFVAEKRGFKFRE
jgi:hypothetical protein